jgi:hypothetical protein
MNIVEYRNPLSKNNLVFCIVDDIDTYKNNWIKEIVKNLADFTVSNLYTKGYDIFIGHDEDILLKHVTDLEYNYAVVMSPGTEYINGLDFFNELEKLIQKDFFIAGHFLDRKDAYYELHHQCYVINLKDYVDLDYPCIGSVSLGSEHHQQSPVRSLENIHDDYTPIWIKPGVMSKKYNHKCHGWNIISKALELSKSLLVFDDSIRNNKKYYYPESKKDFEEKISWLYFRQNYCANEYIHLQNTELRNEVSDKYDQIIIPASGTLYLDLIDKGTVIFYDYNQRSLDYWEKACPRKPGISYKFVYTDLLIDDRLLENIDFDAENTFINLSNIFCYEGTAVFYPLFYRLKRQNNFVDRISHLKKSKINFSMTAHCGFSVVKNPTLSDLKKPTWHYNQDWV